MLQANCLKLDLVKLVILILLCNCIGSKAQCMHNQFRCSTDGRCLRTEALCNGRKECPNGEDENYGRGGTWSCRSEILADDKCDPATQFRCRFGGCVSRTSLCNGRVDCWGGGDEAVDICQGGSPVVPQVSGPAIQPALPPQTRPRPRPTQATTQRPAQIFTQPPQRPQIVNPPRSQFPSSQTSTGACGPINENPIKGFNVVCENSRSYEVNCANAPAGTLALYSCKKYFTPTSSLVVSGVRKCENGQWTPLNYKFSCEAECGVSASETGAFIVGGSVAKAGKWPWMVAIYEKSSRNGQMEFICGGSLISAKAIVTAAHCVVRRDNGETKTFRNLRVSLGRYYRSYDRTSTGMQERSIADVYVPPEYNRITLSSDIAIIKLSEPVDITDTVRPVCLPTPRDYTEPGQFGTLVGWGRSDGKAFVEQLQQAELPVVHSQSCINAHPQFAHLVHRGTFCAGYTNGTSACDGDSGGPLVFRDRYAPAKYLLHGVVSAGIAASDGGRSGCNPKYYTVFTDVGERSIRDWISVIIDTHFRVI